VSAVSDDPRTRQDIDALMAALRASEGSPARHGGHDGVAPGSQPEQPAATSSRAGPWRSTLQWVVAAALTATLAFFTYAHDGWVPILSYFDLGVHEFGHLLTFWAPPLVVWPAGSFLQVAAPLALGAYFFVRGDRFAVILMVAWAAESLNNVAVYIGDAQRMTLTLFGDDGSGSGHDWHNILTRLGLLESTDALAGFVRFFSALLFVAALGLAGWWLAQARREVSAARGITPRDTTDSHRSPEPTHRGSTSGSSTSARPAWGGSTTGKSTSGESASGESASGESASGESASGGTMSGESASGGTMSGGTTT
jgi:hypothetical protein